ncbi:hypothetical protein SCP_0311340 [Sparassis crispa]|uniref:Uncharacterized protein n=1 Tax=Sparassis crispa TaxID=139825 RepID=A0A401GGZ9_9APHY|nr:hypothetical protein SCP_0311340 [Sparassis crispa]GBE81405.1 hypothetical protein SCP_0311340 [Sparassis crispa]
MPIASTLAADPPTVNLPLHAHHLGRHVGHGSFALGSLDYSVTETPDIFPAGPVGHAGRLRPNCTILIHTDRDRAPIHRNLSNERRCGAPVGVDLEIAALK